MKTYFIVLLLMLTSINATSQDVFGKWATVDEDGTQKSIVEIYKKDGKVFGKIIELKEASDDSLCVECKGEDNNKPILGLTIIKGLTKTGVYYRNGSIVDPENGKTYKCRLSLDEDNPDILEVRGYVAFMYESQYWKRVK